MVIRIPPLNQIPEEYIADPKPEQEFSGSPLEYLHLASVSAVEDSKEGPTITKATLEGLKDGLKLTATLTGTVLVIGLFALTLNAYTVAFEVIATPLVPIMSVLGIPEPKTAAIATIVGFAEVIVGASVAAEASLMTKFIQC
ncbi:hypothetical protein [Halostagnicola sp. A56]|uniref:hypothetical protein n=1 Tax=Halostagnicola sp. A56 TaxID=1495067 RepID=UPI0012E2D86E|nr:hypothetical protein [Halostagnicola sp. A56]